MNDVMILGGGPAGLSAAVALGRAGRRVVVLDAGEPRNRVASHMHTVLGHEGTDPAELLARGRREAEGYGVTIAPGRATSVREVGTGTRGADDDGPLLEISTSEGAVVIARGVVVATGLTDRLPEIPGLAERWGSTVLHCPYCHGWEVRGRRLGVLAHGPLGLLQAQLIRQWSEHLTVFVHGIEVPDDVERRLRSRGVEVIRGEVLEVVDSDGGAMAVRSAGEGTPIRVGGTAAPAEKTAAQSEERVTEIDAMFTASTLQPNDGFLAPLALDRTELPMGMGSFLAVDPSGRTSHARVWAIGNVVNPALGVAASTGAGTQAAGAVNMALIAAEFDAAERDAAAKVPG